MRVLANRFLFFIASLIMLATIILMMRLPESVLNVLGAGIIISGFALLFVSVAYTIVLGGIFIRKRKAEANKMESDSVLVLENEHGVFVRDNYKHAYYRALHLNPAYIQNGIPANYNEADLALWQTHTLRKRAAHYHEETRQEQKALGEPKLDLFTTMMQPGLAYGIIGGQQVGKTYQAQRIARQWLSNPGAEKPVVIAPKWDNGEWAGCCKIGGQYNYSQVERGLLGLQQLASQLHSSGQSHKSHPIRPVFLDDWTHIVESLDIAERVMIEATTLFASVNILLYFLIHADTANAWGVNKKGAALKDNLLKLFLIPSFNNGMIERGNVQGVIRFPGTRDDKPVNLLGNNNMIIDIPSEVSQRDKILQAYSPDKSMRQISQEVWGVGSFGSHYNNIINQVLGESKRE